MNSNSTVNTSRIPRAPRTSRLGWVVAALLVVTLAAVALGGILMLGGGMGTPADLDYATTRLSEQGLYRVSFTLSEPAVPINQLHTWTLHVETPDGQPIDDATIAVDGDMPQHGHGLPTRPQVTQNLGGGDYLVEGMKFQMGGWWVMDFDITTAGQRDRVTFNLMLK